MTSPTASGDSRLNRSDACALGGLLLFLLIFFGVVFTMPPGRCLGRLDSDARNVFYGWRAFVFGEIRAGRFPLWNPYELLGMPSVASLQSAMFYPTNWLCAILPLGRAISLGMILNLWLAGLFTHLWGRRYGLRPIGALVAAATYVFAAPQLLRVVGCGDLNLAAMMPWIPCILYCIEMFLSGGFHPLAIALGATAVAMEWFGGNPQYAFYGGIASVLYLAGRLWGRRELGARGAAGVLGSFALVYVLGSVLAGVQVLPALELLAASSRGGAHSYASIAEYSFVPEGFFCFLAPDLFGTDLAVRHWGRWNLWETSPYVGVVALGLAILALLRGRRGRGLLPAFLALVCVALALAGAALFFGLIPGFGLFRAQGRWLCPASLFLGLLAGLGADGVLACSAESWTANSATDFARADGRSMRLLCGLAALLILAGGIFSVNLEFCRTAWIRLMDALMRLGPEARTYLHEWKPSAEFKLAAMRAAAFSILRGGLLLGALAGVLHMAMRPRARRVWIASLLLALAALDVWTFGRRYVETFDPRENGISPGAVEFLAKRPEPFRFGRNGHRDFPASEGMAHGLACVEGIEPNAPAIFRDAFWSLQGRPLYERFKSAQFSDYFIYSLETPLRMFNLSFLVSLDSRPKPPIEGLRTIYRDEQTRIDELPDPWPRAWLVHRYAVRPGDELLDLLPRFDYEHMALLETDPHCAVEPAVEPGSGAETEEARSVQYEPARVAIHVRAATAGLLVLSDLHYPGWEAAVDRQAVKILRANYLMRAVAIPRGQHEVEFTYRPASFRAGLALSAAGCLALAALLLWALLRRKGRQPEGDS
jgi:hypothetical protein